MGRLSRWTRAVLVARYVLVMFGGKTRVGRLEVYGARSRRARIAEALCLLQEKLPDRFQHLERTMDTVVATDYTSVLVEATPAIVRVGLALVDGAQPYQLAAYLCHAARHCDLYAAARSTTDQKPHPTEYYVGAAEADCVAVEVDVLFRLGASAAECRWVRAREVSEHEITTWSALPS